jgi:hypothetical protein
LKALKKRGKPFGILELDIIVLSWMKCRTTYHRNWPQRRFFKRTFLSSREPR